MEKAGRKQISPDRIEEEIEDIAGIRILCQFVEDIPKVIEMVRKRKDMTVIEERDYITNTKPSGYRSYHMIIRYPLFTALGEKTVPAEIDVYKRQEPNRATFLPFRLPSTAEKKGSNSASSSTSSPIAAQPKAILS